MTAHKDDPPSHNDDCVTQTVKTAAGASLAGLFVSALQNTLARHDQGARGVLTRSGGTIATFAVVGGVFTATECFVASLRHDDEHVKDPGPYRGEQADVVPSAVAGCAAGIVASLRSRSLGVSTGACAAFASTMVAYHRTGGWFRTGEDAQHGLKAETQAEQKERRRRGFFRHPEQAKIGSKVALPEDNAELDSAAAS